MVQDRHCEALLEPRVQSGERDIHHIIIHISVNCVMWAMQGIGVLETVGACTWTLSGPLYPGPGPDLGLGKGRGRQG